MCHKFLDPGFRCLAFHACNSLELKTKMFQEDVKKNTISRTKERRVRKRAKVVREGVKLSKCSIPENSLHPRKCWIIMTGRERERFFNDKDKCLHFLSFERFFSKRTRKNAQIGSHRPID